MHAKDVRETNAAKVPSEYRNGDASAHVQTTCGLPLQQSLPQDAEHLALAMYDDTTTCAAVREPTKRLYEQHMKLDFVDVLNPEAWALSYHTCGDTTWEVSYSGTTGTETKGPVDTYVFWYNPCNSTESIVYDVTLLADSAIPHYPSFRLNCMVLAGL
jgi:hypothetical protein